jgi:Tfp pilus assembly protein PilN
VKTIHLNLAARPYRDTRPFTIVTVVLAMIIAGMTYINADTFIRYRHETRTTTAKIATLQAQTAEEQRGAAAVVDRVKRIDIDLLATQTQFANAQLAERAFSWSELLDRLERVLPNDVRIGGVAPQFDKNGLVHLALKCETKTGQGMVNTINRFNADPHFTHAFPTSERHVGENAYQFDVSVDYKPSMPRVVTP